jgi:hypothetical protein
VEAKDIRVKEIMAVASTGPDLVRGSGFIGVAPD